jgi:hypothetical protein
VSELKLDLPLKITSQKLLISVMGINEMVRRRVDYNSAVHIKEDHRHAHRIDRHRFGQDDLSPSCIGRAKQNSAPQEILGIGTGAIVGVAAWVLIQSDDAASEVHHR